ncbi:MAG: peptidylprolyl isomerase [Spirochaetaceae bacterium]|jgi:parvulin-like peptidyl-prolyl isomerase|nr:peptidylprolyl isomerase [Spirochaetaceae bacterium]
MSYNKKTTKKTDDNTAIDELKRRFHSNPFVFTGTIIVLVIVIIAFVLVPAIVPSAGGLDSGKLTFGYYNGAPLSYNGNNFFARAREEYSKYVQYYNWDEYTVWQRAYYAYLGRTAKLAIMKQTGYTPTTEHVNERTAKLPQFLDENGKFSRSLYNRLDASTRITLIEDVKNDAILERYDSDITNVLVSSKEKEFIGGMAKTQRSFKIAAIAYSAYPDDEVKAFITKNPDLFVTLHLSQITVAKESDANKILRNIKDGVSNFEDSARNQSKDEFAERGGDAGTQLAYEIRSFVQSEEDRAALHALTKGSMSEVIKTKDGWTIFTALEDAKSAGMEDATLVSRARIYINTYERGMLEDYLLAKAQTATANTAAGGVEQFEKAAGDEGFTVSGFGPMPLNYGDSRLFSALTSFGLDVLSPASNDPKSSASFNETFWKTAFSTPSNTVSKPLVLNGHQTYVTLIFPTEENLNDTAAKGNTESMFTDSWAENTIYQNFEETMLTSSKFEDNFDATFKYLFPDQYYQHSFSSFSY